ncbi:ABC transporter permease, partial [Mycobacterium tuberculosis]|nr:ABC transporter permease [Mycobacterium tuberculosis]
LLPGDVAAAVLGNRATPENLAVFRHQLGLDAPAYQRYLDWMWRALQGDLGTALTNRRAIAADLIPRLGNTLFLAGLAAAIAVPLAVGLG